MTMRPPRPLRFLLLTLLATCAAACAPKEPAPNALPPEALRLPPPPLERAKGPEYAAPQLAITPDGNVHLLWLAIEWRKTWDVLFARSQDLGTTWSQQALSLKPGKARIAGGIRIAAGPRGLVYVAWREMDHNKINRNLVFVRSVDQGRNWEPHRSLSSSNDLVIPHLLAEQDGGVYVAWLAGSEHSHSLDLAISSDFGLTFPPNPIRLTAADPKSEFGINRVRLASSGEGHLYAVWQEVRGPRDYRIYLNRSLDRGRTWAPEPILLNVPDPKASGARNPWMVTASGGWVYVAWEQAERRWGGPKDPDALVDTDRMLYVTRSLDYGETWLSPPIRVNEAGPTPITVFNPQLSTGKDGEVYAIWLEADGGPDPKRLMSARSADSGQTWSSPPVRFDLTSPFGTLPTQPMIRSDNAGHVWVLWQELTKRPRGWQLLINRSDDHGKAWLKQAIPITSAVQRRGSFRGVDFENDERGRLYVAWDGGSGNSEEIYFNRSTDFGVTWLPREIRIGKR